jgi:hypothetical protein
MNYRIVPLEMDTNGEIIRCGVYCGADLVYDFTGEDAVSVCIEWRMDAQS